MSSQPQVDTERLFLVLPTLEDARHMIEGMTPAERAEVSDDWVTRVMAATAPDPWLHGFAIRERDTGRNVGSCGYKGPPSEDGVVEIAYAIDPEWQGRGYATEAAGALVSYASESDAVRLIRAHTLTEEDASTSVLTKSGFEKIGEVVDPEDGPVWRWEKRVENR